MHEYRAYLFPLRSLLFMQMRMDTGTPSLRDERKLVGRRSRA